MINNETRFWQWGSHTILLLLSMAALLPIVLVFMSSMTDEMTILTNGYSFFRTNLALMLTGICGITQILYLDLTGSP